MIATRRPKGMTLLDLMVLIFVLGVLMALGLPALTSNCRGARRVQCGNNLKNLAIGLQGYAMAHGTLVPGRSDPLPAPDQLPLDPFSGGRGTPWLPPILAYIDQQDAANAYNFDLGAEGPSSAGLLANAAVTSTRIGVLSCPDDRGQSTDGYRPPIPDAPALTRGNYAVNWGQTDWGQTGHFPRAPFGHGGGVRLQDVTDGLSTTIFLSEILQGAEPGDARGVPWLSLPGSSSYMARHTPHHGGLDGQEVPAGDRGDSLPVGTCSDRPDAPCSAWPRRTPSLASNSARSQHRDGIYVSPGDGSVRFLTHAIDPRVWSALHSIAGGEALGADW